MKNAKELVSQAEYVEDQVRATMVGARRLLQVADLSSEDDQEAIFKELSWAAEQITALRDDVLAQQPIGRIH